MEFERNKLMLIELEIFKDRISRYRQICGDSDQWIKLKKIQVEIELFIARTIVDDYSSIIKSYKELKNTYGIN